MHKHFSIKLLFHTPPPPPSPRYPHIRYFLQYFQQFRSWRTNQMLNSCQMFKSTGTRNLSSCCEAISYNQNHFYLIAQNLCRIELHIELFYPPVFRSIRSQCVCKNIIYTGIRTVRTETIANSNKYYKIIDLVKTLTSISDSPSTIHPHG